MCVHCVWLCSWLPIFTELAPANKAKATTVIHASFAVVCAFYIVFGSVCYLMFGSTTGGVLFELSSLPSPLHTLEAER